MKQIIQDLKSGETLLQEVPIPLVSEGNVLIKTHKSLVSIGTEKMLVDFGKANYLQKIRQQPEKVKQVLQKIKTDGLRPTIDAVFRKLEEPMPLGYSNAGEVIAIGKGVSKFRVGDRVISNGHHAEVVNIPQNLVAKIPDNVSYEEASFTVVGSIGLQGIRLINPTLGETIVVMSLGLIGLITAQLLRLNGCNVIGFDFDENKIKLAKSWGIKSYNSNTIDPEKIVKNLTDGYGADGVLICASTKGNDVVSQAANMSRQGGRIVLVGVVGLNINRSDFYEKELSFQVSCSYGPGRYDNFYEDKGMDYPIGHVRWTEQRNFVALLDTLSKKILMLITQLQKELIWMIMLKFMGTCLKRSIASIISYSSNYELKTNVKLNDKKFEKSEGVIGVIGAGILHPL